MTATADPPARTVYSLPRWISRIYSMGTVFYGCGTVGMLFALWAIRWDEPDDYITAGVMLLGVMFFAGFTVLCLKMGPRAKRYLLELASEGFRDSPEKAWIPWSALSNVQNTSWQRVRLVRADGSTAAVLDQNVEGFREALECILKHTPRPEVERQVFRASVLRVGGLYSLCVLMATGGMAGWLALHSVIGLLVVSIMLGTAAWDAATRVWSVRLSADALLVRRGRRTERYPLSMLPPHRVVANGYLDLWLDVGKRWKSILPSGTDPFVLHFALEGATARRI